MHFDKTYITNPCITRGYKAAGCRVSHPTNPFFLPLRSRFMGDFACPSSQRLSEQASGSPSKGHHQKGIGRELGFATVQSARFALDFTGEIGTRHPAAL